jgi:hypothetical protein
VVEDIMDSRRRPVRTLILLGALVLAGCETPEKPAPQIVSAPPQTKADIWQGFANPADLNRIRRVATGWSSGLEAARIAGFRNAIRAEGRLLDPDAALPRPAPTPGSYSCRLVKLGKTAPRGPAFERFKPFFCYVQVEDDLFTIVKQTGSQRPAGRLWEDDVPSRMVFLGSLALANEDEARAYGDDPKRDMAGVFERIGPFVWRLVIPYPQDGSQLQVFELVPVPQQPKG